MKKKGRQIVEGSGKSKVFFCSVAFALSIFLPVNAQQFPGDPAEKLTVHALMLGGGAANVYDSYLSPYAYKGGEGRVIRETYRMTHYADSKVSVQTLFNFNGGYVENPAKNAEEWIGGASFNWNWHYNWNTIPLTETSSLRFLAGAGVGGYLGAIYNTRNGNNPAQVKADMMINLSGLAIYDFNLWKKKCELRYQLTVPFVGVAFSPNYGQSYYEAFSLGNYDHNVVFAYFGNKPSMQHLLTFDFPIRSLTLRVGYLGEFNQSNWNNLRYHQYSHNILVGWIKTFGRK